MSLARGTDDPTLKKRYDDLALDFLKRGGDSESQMAPRIAVIGKIAAHTGDARTND
jgi:hypothetical protein